MGSSPGLQGIKLQEMQANLQGLHQTPVAMRSTSAATHVSPRALQGIKLGDMQATLQGFLSAGLFFVVSNATPCPKLSSQRPHPHILCAYVFLSVISQFAVHLAFLAAMYQGALSLMPKVSSPACSASLFSSRRMQLLDQCVV